MADRVRCAHDPTRVFVADGHQLFRDGIVKALARDKTIVLVGQAASGEELIEAMREVDIDVDVLVLDLQIPGLDGYETLKKLKTLQPRLPVLTLSVETKPYPTVQAIRCGASGYLPKTDASGATLVEALHRLAEGHMYIPQDVGEALAKVVAAKREPSFNTLSKREREVFRLLAEGYSSADIGRQLEVNVKTISTHRAHVLSKLELKNNAAIIRYAIRHGIISIN